MMFSAKPSRHVVVLILAACLSCKPAPKPAKPAAAEPQVRVSVVTIRTTIEPEKKSYVHTIVIARDLARSTGEHDVWRLFDTKAKTVTFVDDVARTIRKESLPAIVERRNTANASVLPPHVVRAAFVRTDERREMHGVRAEKVTITSGGYTRELWLAEHPSIPRGLFAMMHASDEQSSPLAPVMRDVDREVVSVRGFPLLDRTTVPLRNGELVVERAVIDIAERDVPESLLAIPSRYEDVTPSESAAGAASTGRN